jgi:6-phosphogluconate dehydrogenase
MGMRMGARLVSQGNHVFGHDLDFAKRDEARNAGITWAEDLSLFSTMLHKPRVVIVMVPAGAPTQGSIDKLSGILSAGDIIIDGGNSHYKDSMNRAALLKEQGIWFLDAGVSGGVWGLEHGFCIMIGGEEEPFRLVEPLIRDLAQENGYAHVGPSGAGHFAKMVHNGIEYGMLQAYGEGFEILHKSRFNYDLAKLADLWIHGSVVRSWLLELAKQAFEESPELADIRGYVEDSGEGRWTIQEAIDLNVPVPVIALSLMSRLVSRQEESFSAKLIAALRRQFGGHSVKRE